MADTRTRNIKTLDIIRKNNMIPSFNKFFHFLSSQALILFQRHQVRKPHVCPRQFDKEAALTRIFDPSLQAV